MKDIKVHILEMNPLLRPSKKFVTKVVKGVLREIGKHLSFEDVDIVIGNSPDDIGYGVAACPEVGKHEILIALNVRHKKFRSLLRHDLMDTLIHGLLFSIFLQRSEFQGLLLEDTIAQGIELHLVSSISPNNLPAFCRTGKAKVQKMIKKANKNWFNPRYDYDDWFFGSKKQKISNYTMPIIGYYFVRDFLEANSDKTIFDLVEMNKKTLIRKIMRQQGISKSSKK